jgi:phenylalanyl-tRNA synthetase alpha chain
MYTFASLNDVDALKILIFTQHEQEIWRLTTEGTSIADHGSHEARVFDAIAKQMEGLSIYELNVSPAVCYADH